MFKNIPRATSHAYKWERYKNQDILPAWVADAEYACPQPILQGLKSYLDENPILGYTLPAHYKPVKHAVVSWLNSQYQWSIEPEWIVWTPGVVPAFNAACKGVCPDKSKVIIQTPNYPPLLAAPALNDLECLLVGTTTVEGRDTIDFERLEQQAMDPDCHLMILCNPMNPHGSVLTNAELQRIGEICDANDVVLCSDEIHCDLILEPELQHIPAGKVDSLANNSITLMAASKTFNIAGLGTSFAIIPDARLRSRFTRGTQGLVPWPNILGLVATELAFTQCHDWHHQLLSHLRSNRDLLSTSLNQVSGLKFQPAQATFLAWIDASGLGYRDPQQWFEKKGVGPSSGKDFGAQQHVRLNFACSQQYLLGVIERIRA